MLNIEIKNLMREIRSAREWLKPFLTKRAELIRSFAGAHWREGAVCGPSPENYPFGYVQFVKPQLLFGQPTVKVEPCSIVYQDTADALEMACNYWLKETSQKQVLEEVIDDVFFGFGMTKSGVCAVGHHQGAGLAFVEGDSEMVANYPFRVRVDPRTLIIDPQASSPRKCRFIGHSYEQDLEDVRLDWRNDPAAVETLNQMEARAQAQQDDAPFERPERANDPDRKRITLYELYLPEHGRLMTIAERGAEDGVVLRDEAFFGPDEGPYTLWGLASVPGELLPISPLQASWDEFQEVQTHSKAAADSANTHKRIGVYSSQEDAKAIQSAKSGDMVRVLDPKGVANFEIGGASEAQISWVQYVRDRLEHNLGYGQAQQGVSSSNTATSEQIASQNSDLRVDRMRDRIADCAASDARKAGWYFFNDASIGRLEMTHTDPTTGAQIPATFVSGAWEGGYVQNQFIPPEPDSDHTDFNYEIDPQTMVKTDDALEQKRSQDELALSVNLAPAILQFPHMNWRQIIDRYGARNGTKNLSKIILNDVYMPVALPDPLADGSGQQQLGPQPGAKPPGAGGGMGKPPSFGGAGAGMTSTPGVMADARGGAGKPFG